MKRVLSIAALVCGAGIVLALVKDRAPRTGSSPTEHQEQAVTTVYDRYDPARDAEQDIREAVAEAKRTGKHVFVEVGGEWCSWCHIMDRYFDEHRPLLDLRAKNYVFVKVNFSPENENKQVLSHYPPVTGYPHVFILDGTGKLLHSEETNLLEAGRSYDLDKFTEFLNEWAPKPQ
jgi:thiol:disulfide interchange protein